MRPPRRQQALFTALAMALLVAAPGGAAQAVTTDPLATPEGVADLIADVAPTSDPHTAPVLDGDGSFVATLATGEHAILPDQGNGAITLEGTGVSVALPATNATGAAIADDGTLVYEADRAGVITAIQNKADALQVQTIIDAAGTDTFSYGIGGATPVLRADGGVDLTAPSGGSSSVEIVAALDAPWAVDAHGSPVPSWYTVTDDAVTQHVSVNDDTAFPVVADPRVSFGVGVYISFNKIEMQQLSTIISAVAVLGATAGCVALSGKVSKVPGVGKFVNWACGAFGFGPVRALILSLPSRSASTYTASCYQMRIPSQSPALKVVASSQCVTVPWTGY